MGNKDARGAPPEPIKILQKMRGSEWFDNAVMALGFGAETADGTRLMDFWDDQKVGNIPIDWLYQTSTFIGGSSGKGKSNTAEVILLNFCENSLPFSVIDEENEFGVLAQKFNLRRIPGFKLKDNEELIKKVAVTAVLKRESVVIYFTASMSPKDKCFIVHKYMAHLYEICDKERLPHVLYIDEAKVYIPQKFTPSLKAEQQEIINMATNIAERGRKRGLILMVATQTMRGIDKGPLRQMENKILHGVSDETDLKAYVVVLRRENDRGVMQFVFAEVPKLGKGEVFFVRGSTMMAGKVRYLNWHVSKTPGMYEKATKAQLNRHTGEIIDLEAIAG